MKKCFINSSVLFFLILLFPFDGFPRTFVLVRVGFINFETIFHLYALNYLDNEIERVESSLSMMRKRYEKDYFRITSDEKNRLAQIIQEKALELQRLKYIRQAVERGDDIQDEKLRDTLVSDIMRAVEKVSITEGYSLVLDSSGNFVYGSEEINLTDKVLFVLRSRLLNSSLEVESEKR